MMGHGMKPRVWGLVCAGVGVLAAACTDGGTREAFDREQLLKDLTEQVVTPGLAQAVERAEALDARVQQLCAAPSVEALSAAQLAWKDAHAAWKRTGAYQFGPVETLDANATVDWWPTDVDAVESLLGGSAALDEAGVAELGANKKGLPALEYLLWGGDASASDADRVAALSAQPRRCQLMVGASALARAKLVAVQDAWRNGYAQEFTTAGAGSATYPTLKSAVDQVVNQQISVVESVAGRRMALPLGLRSGNGNPNPDAVECPHSGASKAAMLAILDGVETTYAGAAGGAAGVTLSAYVVAKDPSVDARMRAALAEARAALAAVPGDWREAVLEQRALGETAYQKVRAVKTLLGTEVTAALGVTLTFNDNDGD